MLRQLHHSVACSQMITSLFQGIIETIDYYFQLQQEIVYSYGQIYRGWNLNPIKCYIMSTAKSLNPYFCQLNGHILETVETKPYSGVILSEDLSFTAHISTVTKKANRMLGFIQRNLKGCPQRKVWSEVCFDSLGPQWYQQPGEDGAQRSSYCDTPVQA